MSQTKIELLKAYIIELENLVKYYKKINDKLKKRLNDFKNNNYNEY